MFTLLSGLRQAMAQSSVPKAVNDEKAFVCGPLWAANRYRCATRLSKHWAALKIREKKAESRIKPNIAWDKTPELAANTNPELVAAMVKKMSLPQERRKWWYSTIRAITESLVCPQRHRRSGQECRSRAKAPADLESYYVEVELPKRSEAQKDQDTQKRWTATRINMPILKNHGGRRCPYR